HTQSPLLPYTTLFRSSFTASEKEQKITPCAPSSFLKVVATLTESNTASTATPARRARSCSGTPSFSKVRSSSGSTSSRLLGPSLDRKSTRLNSSHVKI